MIPKKKKKKNEHSNTSACDQLFRKVKDLQSTTTSIQLDLKYLSTFLIK